jgi:glycosyltransferase involved in cell wall biosynthesis
VRVLVLADCAVPVPPVGYGGTERILGYLVDGLVARGHEVTLVAGAGSKNPGRLITFDDARDKTKLHRGIAKFRFWRTLGGLLDDVDVVHSAMRLDYARPALRHRVPKAIHFENPILSEQIDYIRKRESGKVIIVPAGHNMMKGVEDEGAWRPIHNAIPVDRYRFVQSPDQPPYLAFLGRLTRAKGVDSAIEAARRVGMQLKIAGNIPHLAEEQEFFETSIRPRIDDVSVVYLGEVDDDQKQRLLGGSTALLNPIVWDEPFGIVAIEALACGVPVISFARGELPNIVRDGITGFLCDDLDGMVAAIAKAGAIDRGTCRSDAEHRFDVPVMVDRFEETYRWLLSDDEVPAGWRTG